MAIVQILRKLSSKNCLAGPAILRNLRSDRIRCKHQPFDASVLQRRCLSASAARKRNSDDERSPSKTLVYLGSIRSTVKMVKGLSLTTSFLGILAQPILLQKLSGSSLAATVVVVSFASFFIFVTPLMLHLITRRYGLRFYTDSPVSCSCMLATCYLCSWRIRFCDALMRIFSNVSFFKSLPVSHLGHEHSLPCSF